MIYSYSLVKTLATGVGASVVGKVTAHDDRSHLGSISCPTCRSSNTASCYWPWKAAKDGPSAWVPATKWQMQMKLLTSVSWLWSGSFLAITATWEVNQRMKALSLDVSISFK